jgi:Tol biopolymer transport system component
MSNHGRSQLVSVMLAGLIAAAAVPLAVGLGTASAEGPPMVSPVTSIPRLAYVTSSNAQPESMVWVAAADGGSPLKLGPGFQPLVSPTGQSVVAGLFGPSETGPSLALYPAAGGTPQTFGDLSRATAYPLAWSPDSRYVAVWLQGDAIKRVPAGSGLAILDTTTGTLKTIATGGIYGASFSPEGDTLVFARSRSENYTAPVDLYTVSATGAGLARLTSGGRSLNPVWGPKYIAYDRERLRHEDAPVYQIWLRRPGGSSSRRLTSIRVHTLVSGLVPLGFSSSGSRLLAEFEGQDTSEAWTVQVPSGRARPVRVKRQPVVGSGISRDGTRLLVYAGDFEGPASSESIFTVPFPGGGPKLLVTHAAQPSWNE